MKDSVVVTRWEKDAAEERFSRHSVFSQLHDFHRYLEKTEPDHSRSVGAHVLRVFRQIRSIINEENNGLRSVRILLHLLASAASERDHLLTDDFDVWGLSPETVETSRKLPEKLWRPLYNDLSGVGRYEVLRPDFDLFLSHASGALFQEAHIEAHIPSSYWLPGFEQPLIPDEKAIPSETGIYFTPPALARTLAEEVTRDMSTSSSNASIKVFDPACGSGELLKECLRLLRLKDYGGQIHVIGWDKSLGAVEVARFVLACEKRAWRSDQVTISVSQQDSLTTAQWPNPITILVMNPPFKSWELMEPSERDVLIGIVGGARKPNLAMAFARRAIDILTPGGTLGMITPSSLLEGMSGRDTRDAMSKALMPKLVVRLGDQTIFSRALVDSGMYVGQRKPTQETPTAVVWADSRPTALNHALRGLRRWRGAEKEPLTGEGFSVYQNPTVGISGDPWLARSFDAWASYQAVRHNQKVIAAKDIFDIKQGIRLGNDVFIVPKSYVKSLSKLEKRFFRPAVMNPSIMDGRLLDTYYAFYPYTEGLPELATEDDLQKYLPRYYKEFLVPAKPKLKARKTLIRERKLNWWDLLWRREWQKESKPKIVSKYFGGSRSFAFDSTGEFVVVVANAWVLTKGDVQWDITDAECYSCLLTYLSSTIAYDLLRYFSVQVSGGQLNLSKNFISNLPIPNLAKLKPRQLSLLSEMGMRISRGKIERWSDVDELVEATLNLNRQAILKP